MVALADDEVSFYGHMRTWWRFMHEELEEGGQSSTNLAGNELMAVAAIAGGKPVILNERAPGTWA
jgi:hypothetical protein